MVSLETSPIPLPHQSNSYAISAVVTPEQLRRQHLQEIFLTALDLGSPFSESTDKSTFSTRFTDNSASNKYYQDEQTPSCSGHLTSSSEDLEDWEETLSLNGRDVDNEVIFEIFRASLDTIFEEWLGQVQCHGNGNGKSPSPSSAPPVRSNDHHRPQSKRKRNENEENDASDKEPDKQRSSQKRSRKLTPLHKLLACPYFKKDARQHQACCGFGYKKISYVKSHIYQKHAIAMYCPVCQQTFDNVYLRDSHTRELNCERVEDTRAPDGITSEQRDWLGRRGPRGFTEEQQWFRIFEHLFPGHPVPQSPYNESPVSQDVLDFKKHITSPTGLEVFLQSLRENPLWNPELEAELLGHIEAGLGQICLRWVATNRSEFGQTPVNESPSRGPGTSGQSTVEATSSTGTQSGTRLGEESASPVLEVHEASDGTTSTATSGLPEEAEPQLGSVPAFADFELEDRKVDEENQMPPRQLNHEGIAPIPAQALWAPAGLSGSEDVDYDALGLGLPNDIQYENPELDVLLNLPDDFGIAEPWMGHVDLGEGLLDADDFLGDFVLNAIEDATAAPDDGKKSGLGGLMDSS